MKILRALLLFALVAACSESDDAPASSDAGFSSLCGNGQLDPGELCDPDITTGPGACPTNCDDGFECTVDSLTGSRSACDRACRSVLIEACTDNDGCCAAGCDATSDNDCSPTCGNGTLDPLETCDGNCPTTCDDDNACTVEQLVGAASTCNVQCIVSAVVQCGLSDNCCPMTCTAATDPDCSSTCGNGTIEAPETCDGDCPTTCDDQDACTEDRLVGTAAMCNAMCTTQPITQCVSNDGCCPSACSVSTDNDCVSGVGGPCAQDADCAGALVCLMELPFISPPVVFPGGYCSTDCDFTLRECPGDEICAVVDDALRCYKGCVSSADCRPGYECTTTFDNLQICLP